jgi:hypothetical protein
MCRLLQRFLGCIRLRAAIETPSARRQSERTDQSHRAAEQHAAAAHQSPGAKALSFSKKVENHIGAIWYFIHHYNASLA